MLSLDNFKTNQAVTRCHLAVHADIQFLQIWRLHCAQIQIHTDYVIWYVHGKRRFMAFISWAERVDLIVSI